MATQRAWELAGRRLAPGTRTSVDEFVALQVPDAVEDAPADLAGVNVPETNTRSAPGLQGSHCTTTARALSHAPGDRHQGLRGDIRQGNPGLRHGQSQVPPVQP